MWKYQLQLELTQPRELQVRKKTFSSHVIARLHENVEAVLPLYYRVAVEHLSVNAESRAANCHPSRGIIVKSLLRKMYQE